MRTREEIIDSYNKKAKKGVAPIGEILEVLLDIRNILENQYELSLTPEERQYRYANKLKTI